MSIASVIDGSDPAEELLKQIYDELGEPTGEPVREETKEKIRQHERLRDPALVVYYLRNTNTAPANIKYKYAELTHDERNTLLYLYAKGSVDEFNQYWEALDRELDRRQTLRDAGAIERVADSSLFGKISAGAYSVLSGLLTPFAFLETALQAGKNLATGENEPVNKYSGLMRATHLKQIAREASLKDASPEMKKLANILYGLADTAIALPFGPKASFVILTSMDMGETAYNVVQNGGSAEDAFFAGVVKAASAILQIRYPLTSL